MLHKTASSVLLADSIGFLDFDQECHSVEKRIRQGTEGSSWPVASQELRPLVRSMQGIESCPQPCECGSGSFPRQASGETTALANT